MKITEIITESEKKGLYYYVNKRKKAGTSRSKNDPKAPSAQDWENAAKTAKKESIEDKCPTCYQDIDRDFYENLLLENTTTSSHCEGRIKTLLEHIESIKRNNRLFDEIQEQIREWEDINSRIDNSLPSNKLNASDIEEELSQIKRRLEEAEC